ncbi:MAG: HAD hydrolase-like protein [Gemmataceae bacterium]|nr:HAD hydrolase-like protein [Gemmata sp.]MDW8197420.1 HAD hydrolase-like protein [Gemmataceae bacterium]
MPLTLEQYIERLETRTDWPWPAAPKIDPPKAKAKIKPMPVRAVFWTVYGTLIAVPQGELLFEHPQEFVTRAALEKVIKEFKMWPSMTRKPGAPSEYMKELFDGALMRLKLAGSGGEKYPEIPTEKIWDDIVKKLQQKDYRFDAATYGSLDDYTKKIAYFYHASIQGAGAYPGASDALRLVADRGVMQGLLADGQCFTCAQLQRCLHQQDPSLDINHHLPPAWRIISVEKKARKPSDTLFKAAVAVAATKGISPSEILHIGSNLTRDIAPAKKHGFRTALFAGDKNSLAATPEQLLDPTTRPDALITELPQVVELIA